MCNTSLPINVKREESKPVEKVQQAKQQKEMKKPVW